jgi:hypothetical protein
LFRVPIHATYLLYLARISAGLSMVYLRSALGLCRFTGVQPSILLHSLDFIGADDVSDLAFFPGMDMSGDEKRALLGDYIGAMREFGEVVTVGEHAARAADGGLSGQRVSSLV